MVSERWCDECKEPFTRHQRRQHSVLVKMTSHGGYRARAYCRECAEAQLPSAITTKLPPWVEVVGLFGGSI